MIREQQGYDVVVGFWEWYERSQEYKSPPLAHHALDRCEEAFKRCEWKSFGYWHAIYIRERMRPHDGSILRHSA
jgi:hypothetical protein